MKRNITVITKERLIKWDACQSGFEYWLTLPKERKSPKWCIQHCIETDRLPDANWLMARCLSDKNKIRYAVFAAEQVLHLFEKEYPNDDRPRKAIKAAKAVIENPSEENKQAAAAAWAAADAARAAAWSAAAWAAADAARAAAWSADAADAANAASAAAWAASAATRAEMQIKILNYGLELIG